MPRPVWLITGLWAALLLGASLLWPMSQGYDELDHVDMAYAYAAHPFHFYAPGQLHRSAASLAISNLNHGSPPDPALGVGTVVSRQARPSLAQLGGHAVVVGSPPNQMVQHPPLYYWFAAIVLRVPGVAHQAWDLQIWLVRLLSVALLLPVPILAWGTTKTIDVARRARRGSERPDPALLAAGIPLTVPNLIRDGSAVSNDSLLILTTSVLIYLLARVLMGDARKRTGALMGVALAAALLTKGFALVLPPVVVVAYVIGYRHRDQPRGFGWAPLAYALAGALVGGLWWLRNLIDFGSVQVDGYGLAYDRTLYGVPDNHGTLVRFVPQFLLGFAERMWGGIGLPDDPSPGWLVIFGWLAIVAVGVLAAATIRTDGQARWRYGILMAVPILTVIVVAAGSYATFRHWSHIVTGAQGRYLYHVIVILAALAALGWTRLTSDRLPRLSVAALVAAAIATNAAAWIAVLRVWYAPPHRSFVAGLSQGWAALLRWSPVPDGVTILLVGVLPITISVATVVLLARSARVQVPTA